MKFDSIEGIKNSKTFKNFNDEDLKIFNTIPCTVHLHYLGVDLQVDKVCSNSEENIYGFKIAEEYKNIVNLCMLTYAEDKEGKSFIGNSEDSRLNIFLTIFHPEDIPYNHCLSVHGEIYHSDSLLVSNKLASGFIDICKKNKNRISDEINDPKLKIIQNSRKTKFSQVQPVEGDFIYEVLIYDK